MLLFSQKFHSSLKKKVTVYYRVLLREINSEFSTNKKIDPEFFSKVSKILKSRLVGQYSPINFFWLSMIEDYLVLQNLEADDALLDFWEKNEFGELFFKYLKSKHSIFSASRKITRNIEEQILSFFFLHISRTKIPYPIIYRIIPEMGDFKNRIYLSDRHFFVNFPNHQTKLTIINKSKNHLITASKKFRIQSPSTKIVSVQISFLPTNSSAIARQDEFKKKIREALAIIKGNSPDLYNTFRSFTHTILPIDESGIVSYSLQNLPGYSFINLFERDFIDLMDDLIHENGHHFLNTFLNFTELINEDDEKIYYSPWRRSPRPIRGIYHACFTFFWALKLFGDLFINQHKAFTPSQQKKIAIRFTEEYLMLNFCRPLIKHAYRHKKITQEGWKLINSIYGKIASFKANFNSAWKITKNEPAILNLKKELAENGKKYKLG